MDADLPLLSNVNEILVQHYIFNFDCNFENKYFDCFMILFLVPVATETLQSCKCFQTNNFAAESCVGSISSSSFDKKLFSLNQSSTRNEFALVLDCHKIRVIDVSVLNLSMDKESLQFSRCNSFPVSSTESLNFITTDWSLKISTLRKSCQFCFPKIIRISYQTIPSSPSLLWVKDQDKKPAVFTYGAAVNNRSLFPCQEPPIAMATWEAVITVPEFAVVLMSGDEEPIISKCKGKTEFYYFTKKALPLSTLCLAVGFWEEHQISQKENSSPKCRIFSPPSLMNLSVQEIFEYAPYCLKISEDILGFYPFPRIDFLIVPASFGSLGMASPNIVFLSQSLLVGDGSMCSRVSHEIAHGWFGLFIGALDWTEEWLSEGFATFVEDYLHSWTVNMAEKDREEFIELRSFIRRKTLLDEMDNTENDLQILRSSKGKDEKTVIDGEIVTVLKNGQNPLKGFIQVHYIKGYFLLKYLSDIVGIDDFLAFLRIYIQRYGGHLVTSLEFLNFYLNHFPTVNERITLESIYENWLDNPGIPEAVSRLTISPTNKLFIEVSQETEKWLKLNKKPHKKQAKRRKYNLEEFSHITPDQLILLLENILELETVCNFLLKKLKKVYNLEKSNPEVQHRWFELVVKHGYETEYCDLKKFLTNHLAMGVYLYGEMIFSEDTTLKNIAKDCYRSLEFEMEPNYRTTIQQMLTASVNE